LADDLYPWQEECLQKWFANHGRGMVQAVTGAGKTRLALTAAHRLETMLGRSVRVKIVVPTAALMRQWNRALRAFLAEEAYGAQTRQEIGMRGGGHRSDSSCHYMIYVINSARYELARQILDELKHGEPVLLIADECHHYASGQNQLIFEFLPHSGPYETQLFTLGLSATLPSGRDRLYLASVLGKRIYSYDMQRAFQGETVCRYDMFHIGLKFSRVERAQYEELSDRMTLLYRQLLVSCPWMKELSQKERYELLRTLTGDGNRKIADMASSYLALSYKRKSLVCLAESRIRCTCDLIARLDLREKILIFGERIRQAEELYRILNAQYPGRVGRYHSGMGILANQNVLARFREGEIRILITCKALDEGVDVPDASIGIILSGTSVQRQRIQRLGRIIRRKEEKYRASLYYLHIDETSGEQCFLPENSAGHITELEYRMTDHLFYHPVYEQAAADVRKHMEEQGASDQALEELERCIEQGSVRANWQEEADRIDAQIQEAKESHGKNYWICMRKMAECIQKEKRDVPYR
jgi:superfamily II DNA or RNA helicase